MFALPGPPPQVLRVAGWDYRLVLVFKHDFFAATCLYEWLGGTFQSVPGSTGFQPVPGSTGFQPVQIQAGSSGDEHPQVENLCHQNPPQVENLCHQIPEQDAAPAIPKIVVKFGRRQDFCGLPFAFLGEFTCRHEQAIYRRIAGVAGVPRWVGRLDKAVYAIEYIEGQPLDHFQSPPEGFFDELRRIFDAVHARGVAYCDANKRSNVLVDSAGRPCLVDYQISIRRRDDLPWPLRQISRRIVAYMVGRDLYHLYKHKRRLSPRELTPQEEAMSRKRSFLHQLHRKLTDPYRAFRRRFLKSQYRKGALTSPTAGMEDHYQPEKATWRK